MPNYQPSKNVIGWIQNGNSTYTHPKGQATTIQAATTTMAATNPEAAALVAKIKGEKFLFCRSGKIYGNKAVGEGIQILTTNNNYEYIMQLSGMLQPNLISPYYQIISKMIKREMNSELYDRLIYVHQEAVNHQGYIELTNADVNLFDTQLNFLPDNPSSVPITVKQFLQGSEKILAIEPTINTEGSGTYCLIINNKDHDIAIKKIGKLQLQLIKAKDTSPTMISSLAWFQSYLEVNGGPPINASLSDQVVRLELQVKAHFSPKDNNVQSCCQKEHLEPPIEHHYYNITVSSSYHTYDV